MSRVEVRHQSHANLGSNDLTRINKRLETVKDQEAAHRLQLAKSFMQSEATLPKLIKRTSLEVITDSL